MRDARVRLARALTALCLALAPAAARAQLPAPAVSSPEPIHLGGYAGVVLRLPERPTTDSAVVSEGALALLASGSPTTHLGYFLELDAASSSTQNYAGRQEDRQLEIERLYLEYTVADPLRIRVGRFLTPVGQWNENHAEPLTWTSVRPLTSYYPFSKSLTGAMLAGETAILGHDAGYALYAAVRQPGNGAEQHFTRAVGGRAALELAPGLWVGASGAVLRERRPVVPHDDISDDDGESPAPPDGGETEQEVEDEDRTDRRLAGLDARLQLGRLDLWAEGVQLSATPTASRLRSGFVQAVVRVAGPIYLVARGEGFEPRPGSAVRTGTLGLNLRPSRWLTIKGERQLTDATSPRVARGWFVSASVLF